MGKWKETEEVYCMDEGKKVIPERDRMSLVNALIYLHMLRDILSDAKGGFRELYDEYVAAFNRVFEWIDDVSLLLGKKKDAGGITMDKALESYDTIRAYCDQRGHDCKGCLFEMDDTAADEDVVSCLFTYEETPEDWQRLEID